MRLLNIILSPFSWLYSGVINVRNIFFEKGIYKTEKFPVKVISVGNLTVGGTGKTPHVEYLIEHFLKDNFRVGVLSRGYGRKTKGVIIANEKATANTIGDEPYQYFTKYGDKVIVAVAEKRVDGAQKMLKRHPELEVLILDDAYQHRYIDRDCNILLSDQQRVFYKDYVVPAGRLREGRSNAHRADMVIITKNDEISFSKSEIITERVHHYTQSTKTPVLFSKFSYGKPYHLITKKEYETKNSNLILLTSIARPQPLVQYLDEQKVLINKHFEFKDHHSYSHDDIQSVIDFALSKDVNVVLVTEKDAVKLYPFKTLIQKSNIQFIVQPIQAIFPHHPELYSVVKAQLFRKD